MFIQLNLHISLQWLEKMKYQCKKSYQNNQKSNKQLHSMVIFNGLIQIKIDIH